ncbi:GrpB family protein [Bradyrhizobium sp. CIAT3101]|uniref:GrpB family protein n=1 Tax=Bradyrhizobium sp. CIAT3101 TaxID=439387 RepID=UPI0024B206BB|nr:GrpB family protein [Bradyrhizobium sp. CIAT3101]WFU77657.1 GrpB family protein [Bradyrhizobium sp. CIAT3101]
MPLTSPIRPYDPRWPLEYANEEARLRPIFGPTLVEIHHVGSTAVPELAAKGEIDILAVITLDGAVEDWTRSFEELGYRRGGDLSRGHHFFKRDVAGVRTHKLHICREGHAQIDRMLRFREHLRRHPADRMRYQELKLELELANAGGIQEYLAAKEPFISKILTGLD